MKTFQIENCLFSNVELAERFNLLANKFENYAKENKHIVNFEKYLVAKNQCGTIACHGGFGAIILGGNFSYNNGYNANYHIGAEKISKFLGFRWASNLLDWADQNPKYWNNTHGAFMFHSKGYRAFGKNEKDKVTLFDIANHYRIVANNLLTLEPVNV